MTTADKMAQTPPMLTQAVRTLPSPNAQALRYAHPALLLALFVARFNALVADPVSTMQSALPVVFALQAAYTIVCLPAAGSQQQGQGGAKKLRPGEKKKAGGEAAARPNYAVVGYFLSSISFYPSTPLLSLLPFSFGCVSGCEQRDQANEKIQFGLFILGDPCSSRVILCLGLRSPHPIRSIRCPSPDPRLAHLPLLPPPIAPRAVPAVLHARRFYCRLTRYYSCQSPLR